MNYHSFKSKIPLQLTSDDVISISQVFSPNSEEVISGPCSSKNNAWDFRSDFGHLYLKTDISSGHLIISSWAFQSTRQGNGTRLLKILETISKRNSFNIIEVESVTTHIYLAP